MSSNNRSGKTGEKQKIPDKSSYSFSEVLNRKLSRRALLRGALIGGPILVLCPSMFTTNKKGESDFEDGLNFIPVNLSSEDNIKLPRGYESSVLLRWGDPLFSNAPVLDIRNQSAEKQALQFGYNCDFIAYFPLPDSKSRDMQKALLTVNHEFTNPELMFPEYIAENPTREQIDITMAAHGVSIVEIERARESGWKYKMDSRFNSRITASSRILITGPAAGHNWLSTSSDPEGKVVEGTINNCAGGKTPWGTLLSAEENFHEYFANLSGLPDSDPRKKVHSRYTMPEGESVRKWEKYHSRFDLKVEPNEPFRFGWVVEMDPYDKNFTPRKRTALGRTKHEGATVVLSKKGHVVLYSGDDEEFEYIYKFVSKGIYNPENREANFSLLDEGTLYVARFNDDGTGKWLPLVFGTGPLTPENGFKDQGDVLIKTRTAADMLGPTAMDRPEDIETNPLNSKVYCVMTKNPDRSEDQTDSANPRANNRHGHIIELAENGNDPASQTFTWEMFIICGDPHDPEYKTYFAGYNKDKVSPISSPDNLTFDKKGNIWIATDGQPATFKKNDGIFAVPAEGKKRGYLRQFLSAPRGSEICGPLFSPDYKTLFCSIQHPGAGGTIEEPVSKWPDGSSPAKPSVISITRSGKGSRIIGS